MNMIERDYYSHIREICNKSGTTGNCSSIKNLLSYLQVMGGTGTISYMIYVRGNSKDYDGWADAGNSGWSYEEVLPYFLKSENNRDPQVINLIR